MTKLNNLIGLGIPVVAASEIANGEFDTTTVGNFSGAGVRTKQSLNNVNDTTPTAAELTAAFGAPATLGRGFVATIDDADGDTNGYIVWTSDASWYWLKGTKAI
jgi:hypothetical protein